MLHHQHFYLRRCGPSVIFAAVFAVVILLAAACLLSAPSPALAAGSTLITYQTGAQDEAAGDRWFVAGHDHGSQAERRVSCLVDVYR